MRIEAINPPLHNSLIRPNSILRYLPNNHRSPPTHATLDRLGYTVSMEIALFLIGWGLGFLILMSDYFAGMREAVSRTIVRLLRKRDEVINYKGDNYPAR